MSLVRSTRTRFRQLAVHSHLVEVGLSHSTRRQFLVRSGRLLAASSVATCLPSGAKASDSTITRPWKSPFRVAVITDEISQDFDHACFVAAREFGMQWVELRGLWNKNLMSLSSTEIAQAETS